MFQDPTLQVLQGLSPAIQQAAYSFVVTLREAGLPFVLISGTRTPEQNRAAGGAADSAHLYGLAFDGAFVDVDTGRYIPRDSIPYEVWELLGRYAEQHLGLRWGGRFTHAGKPDVNHWDARGLLT